jgi:hypothetical protein
VSAGEICDTGRLPRRSLDRSPRRRRLCGAGSEELLVPAMAVVEDDPLSAVVADAHLVALALHPRHDFADATPAVQQARLRRGLSMMEWNATCDGRSFVSPCDALLWT